MAAELESVVELTVAAWAANHGFLARKMSYIGRRGCADHIFVGYGQTIWIEFKRENEKPDYNQAREHQRFAERGVTVHVIDNIEDGVAVLRAAMDR